ncbi:hypothetical protein AXJ18_gp167 [Streptomyces phage Jay2Jay]|uniref:Uncharacterized protein n=2 Tax=Samistivirus jay2jay TaxID=2560786 RepID=A0A221SB02_9CAUD|nr:hypothetical protein AXJ18_gp167 [Streptomyces phage Jay2Jay]AIW02607.1 hypothetical protein PBI_JAY2JAY_115 [Streptomyces phage Jay2Jay]ASN73182.1 hypothetical protein SEA_WARPY_114 [Streptomyces phage Warpy]
MAYFEGQKIWVNGEPGIYVKDSDNPTLAKVEVPEGSGNVMLCVKKQINVRSD